MQPYVVRQGDFLASIAYEQGFDAETVWNDPSNAGLRQLRSDPNLLAPGDLLQIPDPPTTPSSKSLTPGTTNSFVTAPPTVTIALKLTDPTLASQAFTITELPKLTGLSTDGDGVASFSAPVTLGVATIVFTASGMSITCQIGHLNPINTLLGVFQRLRNLGYIDPDATLDVTPIDDVRAALRTFKASKGSRDPAPESLPPPPSGPVSARASQPPSSPASASPSSVPPPASSPSGASPGDNAPSGPSTNAPASAPGVAPGSDPQPPPSGPASGPPSSGSSATSEPPPSSEDVPDSSPPSSTPAPSSSDPSDNAGLDDNGTLDAATTQMLLDAHGL